MARVLSRLAHGFLRFIRQFGREMRNLGVDAVGFTTGLGASLILQRLIAWARTKSRFPIFTPKVHRIMYENNERVIHNLSLQLPAWVKDPSLERVTWLNLVLARLWPALNECAGHLWTDTIWPIIVDICQLPPDMVVFQRFHLGNFPPTIEYVKHVMTPEDESVIEARIHFRSNCSVIAQVAPTPWFSTLVHLSEVHFSCLMRVSLGPLLDEWPCFGGINLSFMEKPDIDAKLSIYGLDLLSLGPLEKIVKNIVHRGLQSQMLWPRWFCYPLFPEVQPRGQANRSRAVGSLELRIVQAVDMDYIFMPSPFVKAYIQSDRASRTKALPQTNRPQWQESLRLLVFDSEADVVKMELRDANAVLLDSLMGTCALPVSFVKENTSQSSLFLTLKGLSGDNVGMLEVSAKYWPLFAESFRSRSSLLRTDTAGPSSYTDGQGEDSRTGTLLEPGVLPESKLYGSARGGVLEVHVLRAADLELFNCSDDEFVFCKLHFAGEEHSTGMVSAQTHPRWNETFDFMCRPEDMEGRLAANIWLAENSLVYLGGQRRKLLGSAEVDLRDVMRNRRIVDVYSLQGKQGYLKLELVWLYH